MTPEQRHELQDLRDEVGIWNEEKVGRLIELERLDAVGANQQDLGRQAMAKAYAEHCAKTICVQPQLQPALIGLVPEEKSMSVQGESAETVLGAHGTGHGPMPWWRRELERLDKLRRVCLGGEGEAEVPEAAAMKIDPRYRGSYVARPCKNPDWIGIDAKDWHCEFPRQTILAAIDAAGAEMAQGKVPW
jgi:hypothetical protein